MLYHFVILPISQRWKKLNPAAVEDRGSNLKLARFHVSLPWNRDGCVPVPVPSALAAARLWLGPVKIPAIDGVLIIWYCKKLWQSPFSHLYNYQMLRVWFMIQSHTIPYPIWPSGIDAMLGVERWSLATSCPGQRLHCLPSVHCGQCTILCLCRDSQRWSLGAELISLSNEIMMFEKRNLFLFPEFTSFLGTVGRGC